MSASTIPVAQRFDAVYMLLFNGWSRELRGNRWYWAKRWANHAPTVIVQPSQPTPGRKPIVENDPRLPHVSILHVLESGTVRRPVHEATVQAGQVMAHMRESGHERVLLWNYNPRLAGLFCAVPAVGRVHHATENYYAFTGLGDLFMREVTASLAAADLAIAVSSGVARDIHAHVPETRVALVTNGCEFGPFDTAGPDPELRAASAAYERIAIYAGNVNSRLDFQLMLEAAASLPDTLFAVFGRVYLDAALLRTWDNVLAKPNIRFFGAVDPDRIPSLYAAADLGFIPYTRVPLIVDNGFPLKLLDMAASGLPVVATEMTPIRGLSRGIFIAESPTEFIAELARRDRSSVSADDLADLRTTAKRNDYDRKFDEANGLVDEIVRESPRTRLDVYLQRAARDEWRTECLRLAALAAADKEPPARSLLPATLRRRSAAFGRRLLRI